MLNSRDTPMSPLHSVKSLLFRDFITSLHYTEPIKFANGYYLHYPKVAIGHGPPFFYLLAGLGMLLFSPSQISVMLGLASLTKFLSHTDWDGKVFACLYQTPDALLEYLSKVHIDIVVSDTLPPACPFQHQRVLTETIAKYPDRLRLIASLKGETQGIVSVYRVNYVVS
jgi:hypothetical protein